MNAYPLNFLHNLMKIWIYTICILETWAYRILEADNNRWLQTYKITK